MVGKYISLAASGFTGAEDGFYKLDFGDYIVDVFFERKKIEENKKLLVFFGGSVGERKGKIPPFFSGQSITKDMSYGLLCISDPSFDLNDDIALAWYAGGQVLPRLQDRICDILEQLSKAYGCELLLVGGSGGGFAALVTAGKLSERGVSTTALIWNAQTDITKYHKRFVIKYIETLFCGDCEKIKNIDEKSFLSYDWRGFFMPFNVVHNVCLLSYANSRIFYLQSSTDSHLNVHAMPFARHLHLQECMDGRLYTNGRHSLFVENWGQGHVPPPKILLSEIIEKVAAGAGDEDVVKIFDNKIPGVGVNNYMKSIPTYKVAPVRGGIELSFDAVEENMELAAYVLSKKNRQVEKKIWYQKSLRNFFIPLIAGEYVVKFFLKERGQKEYKETFLSKSLLLPAGGEVDLTKSRPDSLIADLEALLASGVSDKSFGFIRSAKHGSQKVFPDFFLRLSEACYSLLRKIDGDSNKKKFLLDVIFYCSSGEYLRANLFGLMDFIFDEMDGICPVDLNYWIGLAAFKNLEFQVAENAFSKMLEYKESLAYHQTGAISYLHDLGVVASSTSMIRNVEFVDCPSRGVYKGCILISCDVGYYVAYVKNGIGDVPEDLLVHLHFILHNDRELSEIVMANDFPDNVRISYERAPEGNWKTYCSVSRYMILEYVFKRYGLTILVADADLDFTSVNFDVVFGLTMDEQILLSIKDSDIPWLQVMAGFNVFGKNTFESNFLHLLKKYLNYCLLEGRDGWMLDQVALGRCYAYTVENPDFEISGISIDSVSKVLGVGVRQVSGRAARRSIASAVVSSFK